MFMFKQQGAQKATTLALKSRHGGTHRPFVLFSISIQARNFFLIFLFPNIWCCSEIEVFVTCKKLFCKKLISIPLLDRRGQECLRMLVGVFLQIYFDIHQTPSKSVSIWDCWKSFKELLWAFCMFWIKQFLLPLTDIVEQNKVSFSPQVLLSEVTPGEVWLGEQRAIDQIFENFQKKEKTHLFDSRC